MHSQYDGKLFKEAKAKIFDNARTLRLSSTKAEDLLWQELRNRKLLGLKFRCQHPLNTYVADFYCSEKSLVIEVDGNVHDTDEIVRYDEWRTKELNNLNVHVLRFRNDEVKLNMPAVLKRITDFLTNEQKFKL